eukprot:gene12911-17199_t
MEVIGKAVHPEPGGNMTVEFVGEAGDVVSVHIKKTEDDNLNRNNAEDRAKVMLVQVVNFGPDEVTPADQASEAPAGEANVEAQSEPGVSPAVASLRSARAAQDTGTLEDHLQEGLESSFPASDPVSASPRLMAAEICELNRRRQDRRRFCLPHGSNRTRAIIFGFRGTKGQAMALKGANFREQYHETIPCGPDDRRVPPAGRRLGRRNAAAAVRAQG